MNKTIKSFIFLFVLSFISVFADKNVSKEGLVEGIKTNIKSNVQNLLDLDYYKSKSLSIVITDDLKLVIDWGFSGAGDIFTPYPTVILKIDQNSSENKDKFSVSDLTKIIIMNEIKKKLKTTDFDFIQKNVPVLGWFLQQELSPLKVFYLKLFLLLKNSLQDSTNNEIRNKVEILRLLFKLSQSGVSGLIDKDKNLSSYLPEQFKEIISLKWINFVDSMWASLVKGAQKYQFNKDGAYDKEEVGVATTAFVFTDEIVARNIFEVLRNKENLTSTQFEQDLSDLSKANGFDIIDLESFNKYKKNKLYKFVGNANFGRVTKNSNIDSKLKAEILSVDKNNKVILIRSEQNEFWVSYVSDKLGLIDTYKLLFHALLKTFNDYKDLNREIKDLNFIQERKLSEQELMAVKQLNEELEELKYKLSIVDAQFSGKKVEIEKWKATSGSNKVGMAILGSMEEEFQKISASKELLEKKIEEAKEKINNIENGDESIVGKNPSKSFLLKLIQAFISSPEFKSMLDDLNGSDPKYKNIKEDLIKRIKFIFQNSEHFQENIDIYDYLVKTLFAENNKSFSVLKA